MNRFVRALTLLFGAVQFALPAALAVADGAAAAGGRNSAAHMESKGDRDCKPPHTADCAICRFLTAVHSQAAMPTAAVVATEISATPTATVALFGTESRFGFNSRAPPALLD